VKEKTIETPRGLAHPGRLLKLGLAVGWRLLPGGALPREDELIYWRRFCRARGFLSGRNRDPRVFVRVDELSAEKRTEAMGRT